MGIGGRRSEDPIDQWAAEVLGRWLFEWRSRSGASQRRVAQLAGIDQGGLSRIERGQARPSGFRLARLIVTLDWLCGGGRVGDPWALLNQPRPWVLGWDAWPTPPAVLGSRSMVRVGATVEQFEEWQEPDSTAA